VIQVVTQCQQRGEGALEGNTIGNRHGTEVVEYRINAGMRAITAYEERFHVLAHPQRCWPILEVIGRTVLVPDGGTLRQSGDAPLALLQGNRQPHIVGKYSVAPRVS